MSHSRKHLKEEVWEIPKLEENQKIVKISEVRGNNCEVEYPNGTKIVCLIPAKFRKAVWIRRGSYAIIDPLKEQDQSAQNAKIKGILAHLILYEQLKDLMQVDYWPEEFKEKIIEEKPLKEDDSDSQSDDDLFVNSNRKTVVYSEDEESEDSDEE